MQFARMATATSTARRQILVPAGFLAAVLLLLGIVPSLVFWRIVAVGDQLANDTGALSASVEEITRLMVDQETGLRGYALTGDHRFLEPYETAGRELEPRWWM